MNIAVCDDELNIVNTIENSIEKMPMKGLSCDVFLDGEELIEHINKKNSTYNIYLLDIEKGKYFSSKLAVKNIDFTITKSSILEELEEKQLFIQLRTPMRFMKKLRIS